MKYLNTRTSAGQVMPLLMGCTRPTSIESEEIGHTIIYDPITQKVEIDLRMVGTKCLRTHATIKPGKANGPRDFKNETDDSKCA